MNVRVESRGISGRVSAIASKSWIHRALIAAALADEATQIEFKGSSEDIEATIRCITAMGCMVERNQDGIIINPAFRSVPNRAKMEPGESGSTYRFMLPVCCALGIDTTFLLKGRLPDRPMGDLFSELGSHGINIYNAGSEVRLNGQLTNGRFNIPGNVSSQFISGLLFALPIIDGDNEIFIMGNLESGGYVDMTRQVLENFGIECRKTESSILIPGGQKYTTPGKLCAEGDWSNSAFFLCAAAASGRVSVTGLNINSVQGDKGVLELLKKFGSYVRICDDEVSVEAGLLKGFNIDASGIPDLVPALAVAATAADGETRFVNAGRLRLKESDRIKSVVETVNALGGCAREAEDGLIIRGKKLTGGCVNSCGDHRVVMLAACLAAQCLGPVKISNAQAVRKSYPDFFKDLESLGARVELV